MKTKQVGLLAVLVLFAVPAAAQNRIITGHVTDSVSSEAVTSGQVAVQGTTLVSSIRDDGTFTLTAPARDVVIQVRSIGFKRRDVPLPASQSSLNVALSRDYFQLEAIVVTGQATGVEKKNLANAVSTVTAQQLAQVPAQSVEHAMAGKMAGADIQQNTNAPGGGTRVKLRGMTTLTGAYTPLYVVDGVIVSDASIASGVNILTKSSTVGGVIAVSAENNTNRVADLNPNDIESVEVLKGAAASAIYGSKASNGVILITTKRGRVGTPQFTVTQRFGMSQISRKVGLRNFSNDSAGAVEGKGPLAGALWKANTFFDHEEELYGREPVSYETDASLNGGTESTRYFASGLVKHDGGIVNHTYYDKQAMRLNVDQAIGSRINFNAGAQVIHSVAARGLFNNDNSGTSYGMIIPHTPSYVDLRATCPDGSKQVECPGGGGVYPENPFVASNPLQEAALLTYTEGLWRSILSGNGSVDLVKSAKHTLKFVTTGGVDYFQQKDYLYSPPEMLYEDDDGLLGTVSTTNADNVNLNLNTNLVHLLKSSGFTATTSAGLQMEWRQQDVIRNVAQNLVGSLAEVKSGSVALVDESRTYTKDQGIFLQEEVLTLGEKLLLTAGLRADRSSNNADPTKWFYYPKAAASYRMHFGSGFLSELKVRSAFGQSGNQPLYGQKFTGLTSGTISGLNGVTIGGTRGAADLSPERQREIEAGFDATLVGGRAIVEVTGYEKNITDLLLQRSLPPYSGFTTEIFNGGTMRTRGIEAALNVIALQKTTVQWSSRLTFAKTRAIITSLPVPEYRTGGTLTGFHIIKQGYSPTDIFGFDSTATTADPVFAATCTPSGNTCTGGLVKIGDKEPAFTMGISNDFGFKRMHLYFLWDWKKGGMAGDGSQRHYDLDLNAANSCEYRVQPSNLCIGAARINALYNRKMTSTLVLDNSWLKLREVTLSFDLPQSLTHRLWSGGRYIRTSLSGRNLLMFTPWLGYDPEGVESGFNAAPTRELGAYPPQRSVWFSLDFGF